LIPDVSNTADRTADDIHIDCHEIVAGLQMHMHMDLRGIAERVAEQYC